MNQQDVVRVLGEMTSLLELAEANSFEIMAFRNAWRTLKDFDGDLQAMVDAGNVTDIEGVGKGIGKVITQLMTEGRADDHDELRSRFPAGLPDMLRLSGIGPKKVKALWQDLGIEDLNALEVAARSGEVAKLKGFGAKTAEKMLKGIEWVRAHPLPRHAIEAQPAAAATPATPPASAPASAPATAPVTSTGRVRVGTSGYSYEAWQGSFYPADAKKADFLSLYAERLGTVEINNSFYRFPTGKVLTQWAGQVPETFRFTIKANQRITHRYRLKNAGDVTQSFVERVRTLGDRLGCVLFQLPPNLERDDDRLQGFLDTLPEGTRYAIEFRHASWFEDPVFDRLRAHHVGLVVHDGDAEDKKGTDIPCPRVLTTNFTYLRLRRDDYDPDILADWQGWLAAREAAADDAFVFIKHDDDGTSPLKILNALAVPLADRKAAASEPRTDRETRRPDTA